MLKKFLILIIVMWLIVFGVSSCKKRSDKSSGKQEQVKSVKEYEAEIRDQINKDNMAEELSRLEKSLREELKQMEKQQ